MPPTLRRSCAACARIKHSCDLRTPRCSRCIKRGSECAYANEPLTAVTAAPAPVATRSTAVTIPPTGRSTSLTSLNIASTVDPFDTYPPTRLGREHVQRLIHGFLDKIAFQYYPLELNACSNPFLISWWPMALGDAALFHVTLQTACLDEELRARRGSQMSDLLMADSVALLRRKVDDGSLALQDGTLNCVITLAAIEFGKGNVKLGEMHVEGVKKLVSLRGGIGSVRETSPLTARMVSWVSMLIMGRPQFETQTDGGLGPGIPPIHEWLVVGIDGDETLDASQISALHDDIDPEVNTILTRLRKIFDRWKEGAVSPTRLHDLTCYVVHRLLRHSADKKTSPAGEALRYATVIYMLTLQGPTYFPHVNLMRQMVSRLVCCLDQCSEDSETKPTGARSGADNHGCEDAPNGLVEFQETKSPPTTFHDRSSFDVWILLVGMVGAIGTPQYPWFAQRWVELAQILQVRSWDDILRHLNGLPWLSAERWERIFREPWEAIFAPGHPEPPDLRV
ncbi:hypothetical protein QBC47DRAFT_401402 [Echria macrotheca]|uniref:Zn(2)-C6 fungal-type domain-containing protein n=1 Tax=Echria macrotheca TaxID=438768 RepID=A0AAJ0BFX3_9PEZI|nr:hypothetical protein QBC47DRAFT_401402 [Echria macrotheca]